MGIDSRNALNVASETTKYTTPLLRNAFSASDLVAPCSFAISRRVDERGGKSFNARANEVMSIV